MADEAAAGEEQKEEKKKKKAATTTKKAAKSIVKREKVVWKIFDANYKEVACFPYSEKDEAFAKLEERRQKKSNTTYFINEVKVPMEDE
ncbi:Na+/H+ and K+/H+ antiporter [Candidatus Scalindua japonica]|uniref:Na+/H+ and K+/H+ antiporter n=2 Tax=Candidatus Scalindua japonica TaxID=1284222 RepID=A0A286U0W2_9BACT|nr:Na+/H+ and K+/H+ antiporter [Candidatus Scalindua japonica]